MRKLSKRFFSQDSGATTIEFAISVIVFVTTIFAVIEFGRIYWLRASLQEAVNVAGRYVLLNASATDTQIRSQVTSNAVGLNTSNITTTITTSTISSVDYKTITATYSLPMITYVMPLHAYTLRGTATVPLVP